MIMAASLPPCRDQDLSLKPPEFDPYSSHVPLESVLGVGQGWGLLEKEAGWTSLWGVGSAGLLRYQLMGAMFMRLTSCWPSGPLARNTHNGGQQRPPPLPIPKLKCSKFLLGPNLSPQDLSWAYRGHHTKAQLEFLTGKTQNSPGCTQVPQSFTASSRGLILICNKSLTQG